MFIVLRKLEKTRFQLYSFIFFWNGILCKGYVTEDRETAIVRILMACYLYGTGRLGYTV